MYEPFTNVALVRDINQLASGQHFDTAQTEHVIELMRAGLLTVQHMTQVCLTDPGAVEQLVTAQQLMTVSGSQCA